MTLPILMKFNIVIKYLEDHKQGYIKFSLKLYFKVLHPKVRYYFFLFIHLIGNLAHGQWSPVGSFKVLALSCIDDLAHRDSVFLGFRHV